MPGAVYFNAFLDFMPAVMGAVAKLLDHEGMKEVALYDFIAKHSFAVSHVFIS